MNQSWVMFMIHPSLHSELFGQCNIYIYQKMG